LSLIRGAPVMEAGHIVHSRGVESAVDEISSLKPAEPKRQKAPKRSDIDCRISVTVSSTALEPHGQGVLPSESLPWRTPPFGTSRCIPDTTAAATQLVANHVEELEVAPLQPSQHEPQLESQRESHQHQRQYEQGHRQHQPWWPDEGAEVSEGGRRWASVANVAHDDANFRPVDPPCSCFSRARAGTPELERVLMTRLLQVSTKGPHAGGSDAAAVEVMPSSVQVTTSALNVGGRSDGEVLHFRSA
jgi:hypothetical protein